jgi:hypothetical protein
MNMQLAGAWVIRNGGHPEGAEPLYCHACGGMLQGTYWAADSGDTYCSLDCESVERRVADLYATHPPSPWPDSGEGAV